MGNGKKYILLTHLASNDLSCKLQPNLFCTVTFFSRMFDSFFVNILWPECGYLPTVCTSKISTCHIYQEGSDRKVLKIPIQSSFSNPTCTTPGNPTTTLLPRVNQHPFSPLPVAYFLIALL